ncbi:hypothetical protein N7481_002767 [Penicillium waksmanii]|uniref:uncharacterized protein n=1 Tax=Penicillium waksmanii TaxID=69791 RepID=UPI0025481F7F|nr:uncharacterized protein N7481_002767 [Penicillium waksmanii]KAJ5995790.1 hypothetical protein N7481_002767 [Penicillium waksmanii]
MPAVRLQPSGSHTGAAHVNIDLHGLELAVVELENLESITGGVHGRKNRQSCLSLHLGDPHILSSLRLGHPVRDEGRNVAVVGVDLAGDHAAGDNESQFLVNNQVHTSIVVSRVAGRPAAAESLGGAVSVHSSVDNLPAELSKLAVVIDNNFRLARSSKQSFAHSLEGLTAILGATSRGHHKRVVVGRKLSRVEGEAVITTVTVEEQLEFGDLLVDNRNTTTKNG